VELTYPVQTIRGQRPAGTFALSSLPRLHAFSVTFRERHAIKYRADAQRLTGMKEESRWEEGRRFFSESSKENPLEEDPVLNRSFCIHPISPLARF
jgi:hypothetical protein